MKKLRVTKRFLAWLLAVVLIVTTVNLPVYSKVAKAADEESEGAAEGANEATKLAVGDNTIAYNGKIMYDDLIWAEFTAPSDGVYLFEADLAGTMGKMLDVKDATGTVHTNGMYPISCAMETGDTVKVAVADQDDTELEEAITVSLTITRSELVLTEGTNTIVRTANAFEAATGGWGEMYFRFTPETTGLYRFSTTDISCGIAVHSEKSRNDTVSINATTSPFFELEADTTYYVYLDLGDVGYVEASVNNLTIGKFDATIEASTETKTVFNRIWYEFTADSAGIYGFSCPAMTIYIGETKEQYASTTVNQYQYLPVQLDAGETCYIMCIGAESDTLSIQKTPIELSVGDNIICGKTDSNRPWYTFTPEKDGVYFFQGVDDRRYASLYVTETSEIADFHPYLYVGGGVEMTANTTYYVYSNTNGNYPLTIEEQNLVLEEGDNDVASNFYGIWYKFTPEETGCYQFSTEALGWITVNTKKNSNVDDGAKVGDSTNPVKMNLQAGETYNVFVQFNYGKYDLTIEKLDLNLVDGDNDVFVVDSESKTWYSYKATQDGIATFNFEAENGAMTISTSKDGAYIYSGPANEAFHMCIEKDQVYYVGIAGNEGDYSLSIDVVSDELTFGANEVYGQNNQPIWYKYTADKDQVLKMTLEGESNAGGATINETKDGSQLSNMSCGSSGYVMLEEGQSCYVHLVTPSGDYILTVEEVLDTFAIVSGENTVYSQGSCPTWYEFEAPADGIYSFKANVGGSLYLNSSKSKSGSSQVSMVTGGSVALSEGDAYYVGIYCQPGPVSMTVTKVNDVLTIGTNAVVTTGSDTEAWYTFTPDTTGLYRFLTDVDGGICINESKTKEGATSTTMSKTSPLVVELTKDTTYYIGYKYAVGNHTIEVEQLTDTLSLVLGENEVYSKGTGATWYEFKAQADGIYNFKANVAGTIFLNSSKSTSGSKQPYSITGGSVMLSEGDVYYVGIYCPAGPVTITATKVNDVLTVGTNNVVTIDGTVEAWYTFTPNTTGIYRFETDVDAYVCVNPAKTTAGASAVATTASKRYPLVRELTKNITYYIGYRYGAGDHTIKIEALSSEFSIGTDNEIYAVASGAPIWYEFTAPYSGTFGFKTTCSNGAFFTNTEKQNSSGYNVNSVTALTQVKLEEGATLYMYLNAAMGKYGMDVSVISIDDAPNMPEDAIDVVLLKGEQTVADVELPEGWVWEDDIIALPTELGETVDAVANYAAEDADLYVNKTVTITITMIACEHNYEDQPYISTGEDSHYQECAVCGQASEPEACTGGEATSEKKAECTLCHAEYGELAPVVVENGWIQDENGDWKYVQDGQVKTGWVKYKDVWYYMNADGIMQTGWIKYNGTWYYFGANGAMKTGWVKYDGAWYYFGTNGAMKTGWVKDDGYWYYLGASGVMTTGWKKISDKWYYFGTNGIMVDGWKKLNDKWYYFDDGSMVTGWKKINNKWYYFYSSGVMAANTTIDGYYINANGVYVP